MILGACGDDASTSSSSSSSEGGQGQGGESDGKYHPPSNGMAMTEDAACKALQNALSSKVQSLACVMTARTCPDLVRRVGGADCLQYDQGTVQGCVTYYQESASCDELKTRADDCAFEAIEGSAPAGCP